MARFTGSPASPFALAALWALSGCGIAPEQDPAIGEAFAGPATLSLRREIDPKSPVSAVVHHGEKLEIIGQRRRFYKVRTPKGLEGWTQDNGLLDTVQMNRLRALARETRGMPSQGVATVFDTLRVHTEPNRLAPSFLEITPAQKVDVVAHKVTVRAPLPKRTLVQPKPKIEKKPKGKPKSSSVPPPPRPEPPAPPKDWVVISKQRTVVPDDDLPPAAHDDWTLIRTRADTGKPAQSGWVLTSRLYMAIPDEVAQYAEGHRITSYASLGKIRDEESGENKDIWLWTTSESLGEDHDFDGYRVFVWNVRRHRYETGYIQRRMRGYFPVLSKPGEFSVCVEDIPKPPKGATARQAAAASEAENPHGPYPRVRRRYTLVGNLVKSAGETPCEVSTAEDQETGLPAHIELHQPPPKKSLYQRAKDRIAGLFHSS